MSQADLIRHKSPRFSAVPDIYRAKMHVGFGLWLDRGGAEHWSTTDVEKNFFSTEAFRRSLSSAMDISDDYVWIYSQVPRFFPRDKLPEAYLRAIEFERAARAERENGEKKGGTERISP